MWTRHRTRTAQEDAVQSVLGNPDLVALILARLPVPQLGFGINGRKVDQGDRWAASQVSAASRRAALRLPWEAQWRVDHDTDSACSLRALTILKARNVQAWSVQLVAKTAANSHAQENTDSAAVLNHARGTQKLTVYAGGESALLEWLRHTLVPVPDAQASSSQPAPVLACLASLSRLTFLSTVCVRWNDAWWVTMITRLKGLCLSGYHGSPMAGLPALESLCLTYSKSYRLLEQWASPRLTTLTFYSCALSVGLPLSGHPARWPRVSGPDARGWLTRLQRLELEWCHLRIHNTGLRDIVPGLTYLRLSWGASEEQQMTVLLSKGLPTGLKSLSLKGPSPAWSLASKLQDLESFEVWHTRTIALNDAAALLTGLKRLPQLKHVSLHLRTGEGTGRIEEGFGALEALLLSRQGRLQFEEILYW